MSHILYCLFRAYAFPISLRNREKLRLSQGFEPLDQAAERIRQTIDFPAFLKELKNFNGKLFQGCAYLWAYNFKIFFQVYFGTSKSFKKAFIKPFEAWKINSRSIWSENRQFCLYGYLKNQDMEALLKLFWYYLWGGL